MNVMGASEFLCELMYFRIKELFLFQKLIKNHAKQRFQ